MSQEPNYRGPITAITTLFFMWGFITCLNDILIPYLKGVFELSYFQANLVQFAFFGAYFIGSLIYYFISIKSGDPIGKLGYKKSLVLGLAVAAMGCLLFVPAAQLLQYGFFLAALFCLGLGLTILQIAANPYVALLGKPETASSRLNLAQAFNSFGTTIAPVIGGYFIFEYFFDENAGADAVKIPYILLAAGFFILAFVISRANLPAIPQTETSNVKGSALAHKNLTMGMIAIFCYVGAEVAIGSNLVSFLAEPSIAGFNEQLASRYLALYWGGAMTGRFVGALYLGNGKLGGKLGGAIGLFALAFLFTMLITGFGLSEILPFAGLMLANFAVFILGKSLTSRTLALFALASAALLLIGSFSGGLLAMWAIIGVGLFNSIMWSNIFTLSIAGLREKSSQGSSLLVMMILGGALIPPIQGLVADQIGIQLSFLVPVLCYVYLFYFGAQLSRAKI
jgi:MFS transporter, FHS family, L-fucose permease